MRRKRHHRSGTAVVEFAVCLPLIMSMVFGVIELSNMLYLQNSLTAAAYEAANVCSATGGTTAQAQVRGAEVLAALGTAGGTITTSPVVTSSTPLGTTITVTCSASLSQNSVLFAVFGNRTMTARIVTTRL